MCQGISVHNIIAVPGKAPKGPFLCPFHGTFSFPARSLQEFATVLRNLEDERIRMVSMAGLLLLPYSVVMSRDLLSEELGSSPASTT